VRRAEWPTSQSAPLATHRTVCLSVCLQAGRERRGAELMAALESLWEALAVGDADPDRAFYLSVMGGPSRLHTRVLDKVNLSVCQLSACRECHAMQCGGCGGGRPQPPTAVCPVRLCLTRGGLHLHTPDAVRGLVLALANKNTRRRAGGKPSSGASEIHALPPQK
jgi:hypothetical protein